MDDLSACRQPPLVIGSQALDAWISHWCRRSLFQFVRAKRNRPGLASLPGSGTTLRRVYLTDEHQAAPDTIPCTCPGRNIAIVETRWLPWSDWMRALWSIQENFLIIDEEWVVRLLHDDHDRFTIALAETGGSLDRYRLIRDTLWHAAREDPFLLPQTAVSGVTNETRRR